MSVADPEFTFLFIPSQWIPNFVQECTFLHIIHISLQGEGSWLHPLQTPVSRSWLAYNLLPGIGLELDVSEQRDVR